MPGGVGEGAGNGPPYPIAAFSFPYSGPHSISFPYSGPHSITYIPLAERSLT